MSDDLLAFGNGASGGIISTADDLLTIMTELVHGSLLPGDLQIRMQTPTRQSGGTYGLGLAVYELSCGRFYGHEGRVNGTASIALVAADRPDHALVAAFNSTDDQTGLGSFAERLLCPSEAAPKRLDPRDRGRDMSSTHRHGHESPLRVEAHHPTGSDRRTT